MTPTLAGLRTRSYMMYPGAATLPTVPGVWLLSSYWKRASWTFGSNFWASGFTFWMLFLLNMLSKQFLVSLTPSNKLSFVFSRCFALSMARSKLSTTSSMSLAKFTIANCFAVSFSLTHQNYFVRRLNEISFSSIYWVKCFLSSFIFFCCSLKLNSKFSNFLCNWVFWSSVDLTCFSSFSNSDLILNAAYSSLTT